MDELIKQLEKRHVSCDTEKLKIENSKQLKRLLELLTKFNDAWHLLRAWVSSDKTIPFILIAGGFNLDSLKILFTEISITNDVQYFRRPCLDFLQLYKDFDDERANRINEFLGELLKSRGIFLKRDVLKYCPNCNKLQLELNSKSKTYLSSSHDCGTKQIQFLPCSLGFEVRRGITNGQVLEVFVKKKMEEAGVTPVGMKTTGETCYSSVCYQVSPQEEKELDFVGVYKDHLILAECKMTKLNPEIVDERSNVFDELISGLKANLSDFNVLKLFIAFELDRNIEPTLYSDSLFIDINQFEIVGKEVTKAVNRRRQSMV